MQMVNVWYSGSKGALGRPARVQELVAEARDVVESPQFRTVAGMRSEAVGVGIEP